MKFLVLISILIAAVIISCVTLGYIGPYYFYKEVVHSNFKTEWYSLGRYSKSYIKANESIPFKTEKIANEDFWRKFHFGDLHIPLPVKNPFYFVVPNIEYVKESKITKFGISILNAANERISNIYFLQNRIFPNYLSGQKIFELPLVRKNIIKKNNDNIWHDVFTKNLGDWNIPFDEMVYNLYLLEFRSKLLNKKIKRYGLIKGTNTAIVEIHYKNMDYKAELILNKRGNKIYSFIVISLKGNKEADLIRYKMIKDMGHIESSETLSDIIFKEFKGLDYKSQVDHEGMLYLLSAWSHNKSRNSILEKAIFYLERGFENQKQLEPLYQYYFDRYGEVFSKKRVEGLDLGDDLLLQKKIKDEQVRQGRDIKPNVQAPDKPESVEEQYEKIIENAVIKKSKKANIMRID